MVDQPDTIADLLTLAADGQAPRSFTLARLRRAIATLEARSPLSVTQYGAVGDNSTDCTSAFTSAIAAVPASGGVVYVPPGTYLVNGDAVVLKANLRLCGAGASSIIKKSTNGILVDASGTATGSANHLSRPEITDLVLDSNSLTGQTVRSWYPTTLRMERVRIQTLVDVGIDLVEAWDCDFIDCEINGTQTNNANPGLLIRTAAAPSGFGSSTDTSNALRFTNLNIQGCPGGAVKLDNSVVGNSISDIFFVNAHFEATYNGNYLIALANTAGGIHFDNVYLGAPGFTSGYGGGAGTLIGWFGSGNCSLSNAHIFLGSGIISDVVDIWVADASHKFDHVQVIGNGPTTAVFKRTGGSFDIDFRNISSGVTSAFFSGFLP